MAKIDLEQFEGQSPMPWRIGSNLQVYDRKGNQIGDVDDFGEANARLIAAAPELLEIVKAAHAYSDYIMDAFNEEFGEDSGQTAIEAGWEPVCFMEFYDNEWQLQNE